MATKVTIELRKKPNKAGLFPLAVRITSNRRQKYRQFGISINLKDWDDNKKLIKASHPEADYLNELIAEKLLESRRHLNAQGNNASVFKSKKKSQKPTFFEIVQEHLDTLEASGNIGRLSTDNGWSKTFVMKRFFRNGAQRNEVEMC